jgi:hypothetical protein
MRLKKTSFKSTFTLVAFLGGASVAQGAIGDQAFSNARGAGMGGADSAVVNDSSAILVNPAALGFMSRSNKNAAVDNFGLSEQHFGWGVIDIGASATLTGNLGDYLQVLSDIDFTSFDANELRNGDNLKSLLTLAGAFGSIGDTDTIVVNASVGSMMQIGHFGVGFRSFGQVGGWINNLDLVNLGLGLAVSEIRDELDAARGSFTAGPGFSPIFTPEQKEKLDQALGGTGVDFTDIVDFLDSKVNELVEDGTISRDQVKNAVNTLADIIENSDGAALLAENDTSITGRGFVAFEIPVSYGYAFNDNLSVGMTAKAIFGNVYGTQVWAFNDDNTAILEDSLDSFNQTVNLGLDASVMYRLPKWQFVVAGNNLNSPTFDGYSQVVNINGTPATIDVPDVTLDPQITLGAAWLPFRRWALATDYELLETGTLLNGYNVQRLSFGSEVDLSIVQLRLGTYKNLAEEDIGWVLTGGLGFQLWAVSVDAALAMSIDDTIEYDGVEYPRTVQAHIGFSLDF